MEELLKKHKPTYEALHLEAKLLNHFQHFDETIATLLQMIRLSSSTRQQLVVMELLASLEGRQPGATETPIPGTRQVRIDHELVLFKAGTNDLSVHREIPAGDYPVEEILHGRHRWLILKGEPWGNAEICWEAVRQTELPAQSNSKKGFLYQVARMHQTFIIAIKGKPWRQAKADSRTLHKEATQFIRQGDWAKALPLLQKASGEDPDNYEIAYHLVQAAYRTHAPANAADVLSKVLTQSRWTEDEERMLKQLKS